MATHQPQARTATVLCVYETMILATHWRSSAADFGAASNMDSKDGAAKNALVDLMANKLVQGDCSCTASTVPVGKCPILFNVCFMFNDTGCLDRKQPSFNAWAHNTLTNKEGVVHRYNDPKQAGTDALTALFASSPADKAICFPPPVESDSLELSMADLAVPELQ